MIQFNLISISTFYLRRIKCCKIILFFLLIISQPLVGKESQHKWINISGNWKTIQDKDNSFLIEKRCKYRNWDYNELINFNTLSSLYSINKYDRYKFTYQVINPINTPVELIFFFALKAYRDFYAFKFYIGNEKIQFINSKIKDPSLKPTVKNNFTISVLKSKKTNLEFNKTYNVEIKINDNKAELYIDGKKEMEAVAHESLNSGKLGFSSRNAQLRIENVKVYNKDNIVFQDDFSEDLIKRWTIRAKHDKKK